MRNTVSVLFIFIQNHLVTICDSNNFFSLKHTNRKNQSLRNSAAKLLVPVPKNLLHVSKLPEIEFKTQRLLFDLFSHHYFSQRLKIFKATQQTGGNALGAKSKTLFGFH